MTPSRSGAALRRRQIQDAGLGLLVFELDLVAHERHGLGQRTLGGARGKDGQRHRRPLRAANQLHGTRKRHVRDVDRLFAGLRDGDDAIAGLEQTAAQRGPARQELVNLAVAVLVLQRRADAEERKVHGDAQTLHLFMPQIVRVRIVDVGECVQVDLEHLAAVQGLHGRELVRFPAQERMHDLVGRLVRPASPADTRRGAAAARCSRPPANRAAAPPVCRSKA